MRLNIPVAIVIVLISTPLLRAQENISLNRPIFAAGFVDGQPPVMANDGDDASMWIYNQTTGWISIDLGSPSSISAIRLLVEQTPPGPSIHVVSAAGPDENFIVAHTFQEDTHSNMWLAHDFVPALTGVRHVKITTTSNPSWLAWREIEVMGQTAEPDDCHARYFGYYWGAGEHPDMTGNYMSEFADHCNIVHIVDDDLPRLVSKLQEAHQLGMLAILDPSWQFFSSKATLRPDYLARWEAYANAVSPHIDDVLGFYSMDEPFWYDNTCHHSAAVRQVYETANSAIKARFPGKPILVTFAYPCVTAELVIPAGYDWISFDQYGTFATIPGYFDIIKSKMTPGQKILLTADGFAAGGVPAERDQNGWVVRARQYLNLARIDPDVVGLWTFIWPSFREGAGVRDMVRVLAEYRRIGGEILDWCPSPDGGPDAGDGSADAGGGDDAGSGGDDAEGGDDAGGGDPSDAGADPDDAGADPGDAGAEDGDGDGDGDGDAGGGDGAGMGDDDDGGVDATDDPGDAAAADGTNRDEDPDEAPSDGCGCSTHTKCESLFLLVALAGFLCRVSRRRQDRESEE